MNETIDQFTALLNNLYSSVSATILVVGKGLLILIIGWILAAFIARIVKKILVKLGIANLEKHILEIDLFNKMDFRLGSAIQKLVYYLLLLGTVIIAAEAMGIQAVTDGLSQIIGYLPKLFGGVMIFIFGTLFANFIRNIIQTTMESMNIDIGKLIANVVYYFLLVIIGISAIKQAGFDTSFITNNIEIIITGIVAALALGYGLASKTLFTNVVAGLHSKNKLIPGDHLISQELSGVIQEINSTSVIIESDKGIIVLPLSQLLDHSFEIIKNKN